MEKDRREFLKMVGLATAGGLTLKSGLAQARKRRYAISLKQAPKLEKVGGHAVLKIRKHAILFIRDSEKTVKALEPFCTHQRCLLNYEHGEKELICPCHDSKFSLKGKVLSPPARQPLKTFPAYLSKGRIIVEVDE